MSANEIIKKLKESSDIIIYGAGKMGQQLAACIPYLDDGLLPRCFVVSNSERNRINNIDVISVDLLEHTEQSIVLIATSRSFHKEILERLENQGIKNKVIIKNEILEELKKIAVVEMFKRTGLDFTVIKSMTNDIISSASMFCDENYNLSIRKKLYDIAAIDSAKYVIKNMMGAKVFDNSWDYRRWAIGEVAIDGLHMEFGVADGSSIELFSNIKKDTIFYGFDSFIGLPESWKNGFEKGRFAQKNLPIVPSNVVLIKGWFNETINKFLLNEKNAVSKIAFLHIDCDLYSSTKEIFEKLAGKITAGTIIAFDEYFNYPSWEQHEHKAFMEFIDEYKVDYSYIAYVENSNQVAVKINSINFG